MHMHAHDYLEIAGWAALELSRLQDDQLRWLRLKVPGPLQDIVENLLQERGAAVWASDALSLHLAQAAWTALLADL